MSVLERNAGREMLDARPLADAVRRDAAAELARLPRERQPQDRGVATLAAIIGFEEKSLRRILEPSRTSVSLDLADRYCCATDRLLYDLYPELRDEAEGYLAPCRKCRRDVDMDIIFEGQRRLYLRCRDCQRTQYLDRSPRIWGRWFQPLPVSTEELVAGYQAGLTATELAARHGMTKHGVRARLVKAGVQMRPRGGYRPNASLDAACAAIARRADARARDAYQLRRAGVPPTEAARRLGLSVSAERRAYYRQRDRVEGVSA